LLLELHKRRRLASVHRGRDSGCRYDSTQWPSGAVKPPLGVGNLTSAQLASLAERLSQVLDVESASS